VDRGLAGEVGGAAAGASALQRGEGRGEEIDGR